MREGSGLLPLHSWSAATEPLLQPVDDYLATGFQFSRVGLTFWFQPSWSGNGAPRDAGGGIKGAWLAKGGNILAETVETRAPGMERQAFPFLMFGFLE